MTTLSPAFWTAVVIKAFLLIGLIGYLGTSTLSAFVLPASAPNSAIQYLQRFLRVSLIVLILASVAEFASRSADMAGGMADGLAQWQTVLLQTHYGRICLARIVLLFTALWIPRRAWFLFGVLIAATFSLTGHAASQGNFAWPMFDDLIHGLAAGTWIGGLGAMTVLYGAASDLLGDAQWQSLIARFSRLAGISLAVIVFTGLLSAWQQVGTIDVLLFTFYGRILILKVILVLCAAQIGAFNRFFMLPRLPEARPSLFVWIRREAGVGVLILAVTALLTQSTPGRHLSHVHGEGHDMLQQGQK